MTFEVPSVGPTGITPLTYSTNRQTGFAQPTQYLVRLFPVASFHVSNILVRRSTTLSIALMVSVRGLPMYYIPRYLGTSPDPYQRTWIITLLQAALLNQIPTSLEELTNNIAHQAGAFSAHTSPGRRGERANVGTGGEAVGARREGEEGGHRHSAHLDIGMNT